MAVDASFNRPAEQGVVATHKAQNIQPFSMRLRKHPKRLVFFLPALSDGRIQAKPDFIAKVKV